MIHVKTRAEQVYEYLLNMINSMAPGANKLPSEEELSSQLGVSRATVREALKALLRDGYIITIHGRGTFGLPSVIRLKNRTNKTESFLKIIKSSYADAKLEIVWEGFKDDSAVYAKTYPGLNEPVHFSKWLYYADNSLVIYGESEIVKSAFINDAENIQAVNDLVEFSVKYLKEPMAYIAYTVKCEINPAVASLFKISENLPIIYWEEKYIDLSDKQFGAGKYYFHPDMTLTTTITTEKISSY